MRKLKRKGQGLLAVVLAVLLAASSFLYTGGMQAEAATPTSEDDFDFADGVITGYNGSDTEVVIPSTIGGEEVTSIDTQAFTWSNVDITSVVIPETVVYIADSAFEGCGRLADVKFMGEAPVIGWGAFLDCASDITFRCQEEYKTDFEEALENSTYCAWTIVTFKNSGSTENPDPSKPDVPKVDAKDIFGLEEVNGGYQVTSYNVEKGGQSVVIPAEYNGKPVVAIADEAFSQSKANVGYNKWITSVTIPDTIKSIGKNAFYGCSRVPEITLPEGLETIGEGAFRYCNSLTGITVPASVTSIGDIAFKQAGGAHLATINVAAGNAKYKSVDGVLLSKDGKTLICYPTGKVGAPYQMPDTVEEIANDAFRGDPAGLFDRSTQDGEHKLTGIVLSENLKKIGERAFEQTSLNSITITSDLEVGKNAFAGCKNLETVIIEEGVTEIPECMFMGMENCKDVRLPSSLKKIGYRAFDRYGAASITLPEGLEEIGEEAFANSELTSVKIPATVTTIGPRAFYSADKLASVEFASGSKMTTIGEYVFNHCTALTSVALPNSVKKLDDGCFSYCFALNNITIPSGVTELGDCVFAGSALNEITLPDSIQKMGVGTFRACTKLTTVKMPKNLSNLGTCTFEDCSALTGVTFPEGIKLTYVPEDTFFNCKAIKNIYLPAAIAETKACSFSNCDSNPTIEYANANLKRNIFDCYAIDPGEAYRLDDDGFYYTTEEITDSDFSEKVFEDAKGSSDTVAVNNDGTVVHGRSAGSAMATCGCGSNLGANVKLTPTSNPKFVYKKASSGMNAGGGQNGGANGGANGGQNGGNGTGNSVTGKKNTSPKVTGTAARTGDEAFLGGYIMLLVLALGSVITVVVYKKKRIGQR